MYVKYVYTDTDTCMHTYISDSTKWDSIHVYVHTYMHTYLMVPSEMLWLFKHCHVPVLHGYAYHGIACIRIYVCVCVNIKHSSQTKNIHLLCIFVCMYIYMYMYIYIYIYIYMNIHIHIHNISYIHMYYTRQPLNRSRLLVQSL